MEHDDLGVMLQQTMDASVWATEFCKIASKQGHELDWGWMIGWFANAIMVGYDHGRRECEK